jgi:hypothetical protein
VTAGGEFPAGWRWLAPAALAVFVRPRLWGIGLRQGLRMAVPGWWRRWPPVPRPDPEYVRFRLQTVFGDPAKAPAPADVVAYLEWCRRFPSR